MAAYDCWAPYYDLIHPGLPGEAEFYVGQAVRIGGSTLELGCGTGRLAIPMAMSGVNVTGLDNSKAMLDECLRKKRSIGKTSGRLRLVQADMTRFSLGARFDFVAMAYRTFMHLLTADARQACLETVREHLAADGLFALNLYVPESAGSSTVAANPTIEFLKVGQLTLPGTRDFVDHHCAMVWDWSRRRLIEEHILLRKDAQGAVVDKVTLPLVRALITFREMLDLFRACRLNVEALFGDFDCNAFDGASTEMVWIVKRA